ncbi:MAG: hypothetical protein IK088_09295, partial [Lachnospiraceae bacterium]|nr:hypothetical protein [Lachnospiraceae bacterium]
IEDELCGYRFRISAKSFYQINPAQTEKLYPGSMDKTISLVSEAFQADKNALHEAFTSDTSRAYVRFDKDRILTEEEIGVYNGLVEAYQAEKKAFNAEVDARKGEKSEKDLRRIAGVWFEDEYRREYPLSTVLSKVVGYTTKDASEGILGLERYYDGILRGTDGKEYTYVDEQGNVTKELVEPIDGYTLKTSLDSNVARILKEEITAFQEGEIGGKRVNVMVLDPQNGEVIAMASDTDFDLNDPQDLTRFFTEEELENPAETFLLQEAFLTRPKQLEAMTKEEQLTALLQQVQINYAVSGTYEPGSTAKAMTLAAGYESGRIRESDTYFCGGSIPVANYTIHCHSTEPCGQLKPIEAFGRSCNVCFVEMAEKVGAFTFSKFQELYNLGQKTNIDLPGEANTANLIYYEPGLHEIELSTNSFGQGFNVTMIQMASVYASLINGGYYYEPRVVTRIEDGAGNTVSDSEPVLVRRTVSEETSKKIREGMKYVASKGTASGFVYLESYDFGGKTGAAEKLPRGTGKYIVSFISAAPMNQPKFLLYVVIDEPNADDQSSSGPAQILSKAILDRLLPYYGIFSGAGEDAYNYDWSSLGDYTGMDDAMEGVEPVDDPDHSIEWLFDDEDDRN